MSVYSIKDLEQLSGIKAHTIRIWEQRYELFSPQRTATNIRFYNEEDLKLILNISTLRNHGYKISKIVEMQSEELYTLVNKYTEERKTNADQIFALTRSMVEMNENAFSQTLDQNTEKYGFEQTMIEIMYPFMNRIGILWLTDAINPAQEHFITHLVKQKVMSATNELPLNENAPLFLLFLAEGELHELGLLLANYMLRVRGMKTVFFGQTVPINAIEEVYHQLNPDFILTSLTTTPELAEVQHYVDSLGSKFSDAHVFITGPRVVGQDIETSEGMSVLNSFKDLEMTVEQVKEERV